MAKPQNILTHRPQPKTLLLGVYAPYNTTSNMESYFEEFVNLATTNGIVADESLFIRLREIEPGTFITSGKLETIIDVCQDNKIERVIVSEQLSGLQERNLADVLNVEIIDRTQLILEIFEKAALSAEGKTQVEIAMLKYAKSRLAGKGIHLAQQAGKTGGRMVGCRGPGERAKELERRFIETNILKLRERLQKIEKVRATQRKRRLDTQTPQICLIGYTNTGKSTILNSLTKSSVIAQDRPFSTLDTTTRELFINGKKIGIISDTVGFIQNLPHQLINAFKATLEELQYADLLLHVIDLSDPNWESQIRVVHEILEELEVEKPMIYVFNKIDQIPDISLFFSKIEQYQPALTVSAISREGLQPLIDYLQGWKKS